MKWVPWKLRRKVEKLKWQRETYLFLSALDVPTTVATCVEAFDLWPWLDFIQPPPPTRRYSLLQHQRRVVEEKSSLISITFLATRATITVTTMRRQRKKT
ncbi:hypothetical protein VNO80_07326 [Phaseolus coccineus]|uniref:Uncharacterized protein n=1 Tax=Phaseolus coccineus TaxID=3886 RepID=A0AAN9NJ54_PHACN